MPWTHYTAPLADGEVLTIAQRGELYDALDERLKAVNPSWGVDTGSEMAALRATPLAHRRVIYRAGGLAVSTSIEQLVIFLCNYYVRAARIESNTGGGNYTPGSIQILTEAAALLGVSWSGSAVLDVSADWNVIRHAIQLLRWLGLLGAPTVIGGGQRAVGLYVPPGLAAGIASYVAEPEMPYFGGVTLARLTRGVGETIGDSYYSPDSTRVVITYSVASTWSTGWKLAIIPRWMQYGIVPYVPLVGVVVVDGVEYEVGPGPLGDGPFEVQTTPVYSTGVVEFGVKFRGYEDAGFAAEIDATFPAITPESSDVGAAMFDVGLGGQPTFEFV